MTCAKIHARGIDEMAIIPRIRAFHPVTNGPPGGFVAPVNRAKHPIPAKPNSPYMAATAMRSIRFPDKTQNKNKSPNIAGAIRRLPKFTPSSTPTLP